MARSGQGERGIQRVDLAYVQLASSEVARDINRDLVLELVRANQPVSRADISRISGLQRSTVSLIVDQLIEERWVREGAAARLPRGRRPTMLGLNDDLVMLAADIRPKQATVAVVDLNGRFLSRSQLPLPSDPAKALGNVVDHMQRMRERLLHKSFEGVGISVPGRVDPETQRLIFAPNLAWPDFDIKGTLEAGTGLAVELENAANACMLAETWFGHMDGVRNAVLVTISEGVGTSVLANGQLVYGHKGMAGEFGHIPFDPSGPKCACGATGCWEVFASSKAALRFYSEFAGGAQLENVQELLRLSEEGDAHAVAAVQKQARYVGVGLSRIAAALSPEIILITGDIVSAWSNLKPFIEQEMTRRLLTTIAPAILPAHEAEVARLRGAAVLVLQRRSSYHLSQRTRDVSTSRARHTARPLPSP